MSVEGRVNSQLGYLPRCGGRVAVETVRTTQGRLQREAILTSPHRSRGARLPVELKAGDHHYCDEVLVVTEVWFEGERSRMPGEPARSR